MNILLVEDDPTDLLLFSAVLNASGHRVQKNTSAEQAVDEIKTLQPDIILLDLNLPGMDGLAFARWLRRDVATQHIPIVAVTAATEEFPRSAALAAGCDAYIVKPVDTRKLSEHMVNVAGKSTQRTKRG